MKTQLIPFWAALGCTLTACGDKDDTEETETDTEDSGPSLGDISGVIGGWTLDSYAGYYGETTFPTSGSYMGEEYGYSYAVTYSDAYFIDIASTGAVDLISSSAYTVSISIDGQEIYYADVSYSQAQEWGDIREDSGSYVIDLGEGNELPCSLTGSTLDCDGLVFSSGANIPEDAENIVENWPATPDYTKEECVDSTLSGLGNALEWGGFSGAGDDFGFDCAQTPDSFDWDTYSYIDGEPLVNTDEFVFEFQAPSDGCFSFNTTGTFFTHGIQLVSDCDANEVLDCSTTGEIARGMQSGETVLVVIDGESTTEESAVFNLSATEIDFNPAQYDEVPADTSAIDTTGWTDEPEISCAPIGAAKTFRWTAPSTGTATFDLNGSDFDTAIQVQAAVCGAAEECNDDRTDDAESYLTSLLEVSVDEGVEYMITLGGYGGDSGTLSMTVTID